MSTASDRAGVRGAAPLPLLFYTLGNNYTRQLELSCGSQCLDGAAHTCVALRPESEQESSCSCTTMLSSLYPTTRYTSQADAGRRVKMKDTAAAAAAAGSGILAAHPSRRRYRARGPIPHALHPVVLGCKEFLHTEYRTCTRTCNVQDTTI